MGDLLTNFLLVTLIGLISWIGKSAYDKINEILNMIRTMMVSHQKYEIEIEQLKRNQIDHETRIRLIEQERA